MPSGGQTADRQPFAAVAAVQHTDAHAVDEHDGAVADVEYAQRPVLAAGLERGAVERIAV